MDQDRLIELWIREEQKPFSGWDFSYADGRMIEEQTPWSYLSRAAEAMHHVSSVVDLDTGGAGMALTLILFRKLPAN